MEMVSKVEACMKGTDLHHPLPCWSLLGFFCMKDFLFFSRFFLFLFFLLPNLGFFFLENPAKEKGLEF